MFKVCENCGSKNFNVKPTHRKGYCPTCRGRTFYRDAAPAEVAAQSAKEFKARASIKQLLA
jgi:DNA-directed RNA polymerase subunit RPC12/RpoP